MRVCAFVYVCMCRRRRNCRNCRGFYRALSTIMALNLQVGETMGGFCQMLKITVYLETRKITEINLS